MPYRCRTVSIMLIGLFRQPPGIDGEHTHVGGNPRCQIDDHHAFLLEAGGDGEILVRRLDGPGEDSSVAVADSNPR